MAKEWYVIHTYSGHENSVCEYVQKKIDSGLYEGKLFQVKIPTEDVVEMKNGRKKSFQRKYFPGYVLVEMDMNDESWHIIKNIPGVTNFVGQGHKPQALSRDEVKNLFQQMKEQTTTEVQKQKVTYAVDDPVKIIDGPFVNFNGVIEEVNLEKGRLKVRVEIFGRSTPVEVDFLQVEKR